MKHEQKPRGKRDHDLLRELQIIRFRWSRVRREAEDGAQEVAGRGQTPQTLQIMQRSWEIGAMGTDLFVSQESSHEGRDKGGLKGGNLMTEKPVRKAWGGPSQDFLVFFFLALYHRHLGRPAPGCGGCPVHCKMSSSTPGLPPLDASSNHSVMAIKNVLS